MGQTATEENKTIIGTTSGTPSESVVNPQAGEDVATLKKQLEEANKRLAEKDIYINEVTNEKAVLETRLNSFGQPNEAAVNNDAPKGIDPAQLPEIIENTIFINKVRDENKDLIELGLEIAIRQRADELIAKGKTVKEAVLEAVKEKRAIVDKLKSANSAPQNIPAGAMGESGGQEPAPTPKAKPEVQLADEGSARHAMRLKRGL